MTHETTQYDASYALLPLRDIVVFPGMIAPLFVGRRKSISALEDVIKQNKMILLVTQKDATNDDPNIKDLYNVGILANILQLLKLPDGTVKVLIEGQKRANIKEFIESADFFRATIELIEDDFGNELDLKALTRSVVNQFGKYAKMNKKVSPEISSSLAQIEDACKLADTIASHLNLTIDEKQKILENPSVVKRLEQVYAFMEAEMEVLDTEKKIRTRIKDQMEKTQKEYYLNEQLKAIHKELGETEDGKDEITLLEERIKKTRLSKEAREKAKSEIKKLKSMSPMSAESTVTRNYLDWLLSLPWNKRTKVRSDINLAQQVLDEDHYGLEKVKERILEYLAVQQRTNKIGGSVICLVGPPGVGKTSLAKSISRAISRKFIKMSLGGVRDESEIRGHRRTYIGSMPGKIIQSMKKAEASNPLLLLDEIDKMGTDFRGDPASALLEVLDSEQNANFNDHYLEVDYDLSDVMFVATANSLNLPHALLDRLEIIRISGYTEDEKIEIAKKHLIDKQAKKNGLKDGEWTITDDALRDILRYYTREAGVRNLERELAKIARKALRAILADKLENITITSENLEKYLGVRKYSFGESGEEDLVGVVTGLAYTEFGGDMLTIEAVQIPGKGGIKTTGKLGEVMQESAQAAFSYARSKCLTYGVTPVQYGKKDFHIHVPEGATPKDGPSAGVALFISIISVMTGIPVKKSVAMTGEITLRGRVLAIGGLKEKLLAALRGGIKTVLIPKENEKDLADIPENVKQGLEIIPVSTADEALRIALTRIPEPIEWAEIDVPVEAAVAETEDAFVTH
jgi:ATP-dependent Lon protease